MDGWILIWLELVFFRVTVRVLARVEVIDICVDICWPVNTNLSFEKCRELFQSAQWVHIILSCSQMTVKKRGRTVVLDTAREDIHHTHRKATPIWIAENK